MPSDAAPHPFLEASIRHLRDEYLQRLEQALAVLPESDLWWRPHTGVTSIGTLLRHLEGNVRQWILSGLAGEPDHRDRTAEFDGAVQPDKDLLWPALRDTVHAAAAWMATPEAAQSLDAPADIQGFATTGRAAIYHVVEHFAWHTGQITWIAKARGGPHHGVAFYDDAALAEARNRESSA